MRPDRYRHSMPRRRHVPYKLLSGLIGVAVMSVTAISQSATSPGSFFAVSLASDCRIKGNISIKTGERIYHVPGQQHYDITRISQQYGERWFCSEQEARQAGWRKAMR